MGIIKINLTHSFPMHPFSTPWKHQKTLRFRRPENYQKSRDKVESLSPPERLVWTAILHIRLPLSPRSFPDTSQNVMSSYFEFPRLLFSDVVTFLWNHVINSFQYIVAFVKKTSDLICSRNQMTGFYMKCNTGLKWIKYFKK